MMAVSRGVSPVKRESRPAFVAQRLPMVCQRGSDRRNDSTGTLRLQRLLPLGIIGPRADLLAQLIWGADGGNDWIGGAA